MDVQAQWLLQLLKRRQASCIPARSVKMKQRTQRLHQPLKLKTKCCQILGIKIYQHFGWKQTHVGKKTSNDACNCKSRWLSLEFASENHAAKSFSTWRCQATTSSESHGAISKHSRKVCESKSFCWTFSRQSQLSKW